MAKKLSLQLLVLTALALLIGACASGGGAPAGPSDEELINQLVSDTLAKLAAKDIEGMLSVYSDDFQDNQGQDKATVQGFLQAIGEQGMLDGIEADTSGMAVAVEGDAATVDNVALSGAFGALTLSFKLEKRDGTWVVTYQSTEM